MIAIGTKVIATDDFGSYYKEQGVVVGHDVNMFGRPLVNVRLFDLDNTTCFYPHELTEV